MGGSANVDNFSDLFESRLRACNALNSITFQSTVNEAILKNKQRVTLVIVKDANYVVPV